MPEPWRVFYSYSHTDSELRDDLSKFLAPLRHEGRIVEWYDRKIEPGMRWESAISDQLELANLILLLVTADFLASDYCFGVEMETAMQRMKSGAARVVPILLKPCLWKESRFSELQLVPRGARPVASWPSQEDALAAVAGEISDITKDPPCAAQPPAPTVPAPDPAAVDLSLVREQIVAYARLYERIRQQMPSSDSRTRKMEEVFQRMKSLANASFPLLAELTATHSPGEKLAAVSILECFSSTKYLPFLVELIRSEKPFIGFHAARAMEFAVSAMEPRCYPNLAESLDGAMRALDTAVPGSDRMTILIRAKASLNAAMETVTLPAQPPES